MTIDNTNLINVIQQTLSEDGLKAGNPYVGTVAADLAKGLREQAALIKEKAAHEYISNNVGVGVPLKDEDKQALLDYQKKAINTYKDSLISGITASKDNAPIIPTEASDNFLKNVASSTLAGAFSGDVSGNLFSALIGGASSLIMSMPFVGDFIRKTTIYIQHKFSGEEADKNFSFADAGKLAEIQKHAETYSQILPVSSETILKTLESEKMISPSVVAASATPPEPTSFSDPPAEGLAPIQQPAYSSFANLNQDNNDILSNNELRPLDTNKDSKITKNEVPDALKEQFEAMLKLQPKTHENKAPEYLDLGNFHAQGIPLANFKVSTQTP